MYEIREEKMVKQSHIFQKEPETNTNLYQLVFPDLIGVSWRESRRILENVRLSLSGRLWTNIWESECESIQAHIPSWHTKMGLTTWDTSLKNRSLPVRPMNWLTCTFERSKLPSTEATTGQMKTNVTTGGSFFALLFPLWTGFHLPIISELSSYSSIPAMAYPENNY
jgi:hypothetical protein